MRGAASEMLKINCGGGIKTRSYQCLLKSDKKPVPQKYCERFTDYSNITIIEK